MVEAIAKNVSRIIMYAEEIAERLFEEREIWVLKDGHIGGRRRKV